MSDAGDSSSEEDIFGNDLPSDPEDDDAAHGAAPPACPEQPRSADAGRYLALFPQEDCLGVGFDARRAVWVLYNKLTFEQVDLPAPTQGVWELEFHDSHVGFLYQTGNDQDEVWAHEVLRGIVYGDGQSMHIKHPDGAMEDLTKFLTDHRECYFHSSAFGNLKDLKIPVYFFASATHGWRAWLCMNSILVDLPGFELSSMKEPSRWLYTMWPVWERALESLRISAGLRRSVDLNMDLGRDWWRCLSRPTMHLAAMFAVLGRLAFAPRHHGGFQCDRNRTKATMAFDVLLKRINSKILLVAVLDDDLEETGFEWLSGGSTETRVELCIGVDLMIKLGAFRERLREVDRNPGVAALRILFCNPEAEMYEEIAVADFFRWLFSQPKRYMGFLSQVFTSIGKAFEQSLATELVAITAAPAKSLPAGHLRLSDCSRWSRQDAERELVRYMCAVVAEDLASKPCVSVALDASRVSGRATLSTIVVLPSNMAVIPPPQAALASTGALRLSRRFAGFGGSGRPKP